MSDTVFIVSPLKGPAFGPLKNKKLQLDYKKELIALNFTLAASISLHSNA